MTKKLKSAIFLLRRGMPLSLDLETSLLQEGIDVKMLKTKYEL